MVVLTNGTDAPISTSTGPTAPLPGQSQASPGFQRNYDIFSSLASSQAGSPSATPAPHASQPQQQASPPPAADPFASLVSASPRTASPFAPPPNSQRETGPPASSSLLDLVGGTPAPAPASVQPPAVAGSSGADEEWSFTSSLPEGALPSTNKIRVLDSSLVIDFAARRNPGQNRQIHIVAVFSNTTSRSITELHFQVAVERVSPSRFVCPRCGDSVFCFATKVVSRQLNLN